MSNMTVETNHVTVEDHGASNSSQISQIPVAVIAADKGEFLAFKADMLDNFQKVNETIVILNQELQTVTDRLDSHDEALINLTSAMVTGTSSSSSTATRLSVSTPASSSHQESTTDGDTSRPGLKIKGINSWEDLHKAFNNSWPVEHGQLDIDLLQDVENPINKDQRKHFDFDGNGLFSEEELAVALGFHHNPRCEYMSTCLLCGHVYLSCL